MTMGRTVASYPAVLAVYFVFIGLFHPISAKLNIKIVNTTQLGKEVGESASVSCEVYPDNATITWQFRGNVVAATKKIVKMHKDNDGNEKNTIISTVTIPYANASNAGNYTCIASYEDDNKTKDVLLDLYFPTKFVNASGPVTAAVAELATVEVYCIFEGYDIKEVKWYQKDDEFEIVPEKGSVEPIEGHPKLVKSIYPVHTQRVEDNGTYICEVQDGDNTVQGKVEVLVLARPRVVIETALGISTTQIYLNWKVYAYNSPIRRYDLKIYDEPSSGYIVHGEPPKNTSYVIKGLQKSTNYTIRVDVKTDYNSSDIDNTASKNVSTLDFDPVFVPNISINGFSATSVTIGWKKPDNKVAPFIHYYILEAKKKDENVSRRAYHSRDENNLPYMFDNLEPHSTYVFKVCAGSDYTGLCGNWSDEMEAATSDGKPTKPTSVKLICTSTFMNLTWGPPERPNAEIKGYTMELTGTATFRDRTGKEKNATWGPLSKFTANDTQIVRFDDLQPNTHYTVRLTAMTRTRRRGEEAVESCDTLSAPPDHLARPRWRKILQDDKYMFKMYLPRISERNGLICCYRVYMVRLLPHSDWKNLPMPKDIKVLEYKDAHAQPPALGAYITDIFSNDNFPSDSELVMGDEKSLFNKSEATFNNDICNLCLKKPNRFDPTTTTSTTTPSTTTEDVTDDPNDGVPADIPDIPIGPKTRRSYDNDFANNPTMQNQHLPASQLTGDRDTVIPYDGPLDNNANYTLFVELITPIRDELPMYSDYVNVLMPAPTPPVVQPTSAIEVALQATCAVAALVLLLMILFCIRQTRRSRKMPPHAPLEMGSLQAAFRHMFGRPQHTPTVPPDMAPIPKEELAAAYAKRQADSDYEFQKEFELLQMLPECFSDRTTHASEARENQPKNRYPDIKAYDQTRVKLSQIDGIAGSDYINANYVMGYQDRKQFICAQGPTDTTVNDFWRMIWEHGLELIVMLTNLEEYSKVKCSKYWPDELGSRAFGGLTVHHVTEKRYSDYIVRELRITKHPMNSEGQPIVEGNGIARNGDCKDAQEGSVPTSPREVKDPETRIVKQYHFLMWKDFAAPEHAYSILKFIKRVNEAWSGMLNRACVVHCSAGVGRTGTLVALDCLLQQLRELGHAAVFNTVAELRRERNFLVQSLKQYVFVYRALVEYAHFEDTEIPADRLKSHVDRLRSTPQQTSSCLMELEFEKILSSPIPEPLKSCAAGAAEELRPKNRSLDVLPYDRNRVILAPIPGRDYSTYINASFIEAYDNSEGFIITQDPMPSTIMDFWRMVSEHNITNIVMLSELGDNKCPRYWDDGTAQYEHISVQYEESESCPYYTRRQFRVVNNKSGCTSCVRQLQYQGWPTAAGHVPEVTRGLAELADCAAPHSGAMLVHCHLGTERSALFVALCILICQLRTERRVDVCCVARKVRSQRVKTINTFLQYEFLHRAILNYAELHNLLESS